MSAQALDEARAGLLNSDAVFSRLIRLSLVVRLAALVAAMSYLIGQELTLGVFVAVLLLAGTSVAALSQEGLLDMVVRHPLLAMADLAVVVGVFLTLGVDNPLAIGALSTAFLTGVLFPTRVCVLLIVTLLAGYIGAATSTGPSGHELGFLVALGMPITFLSLTGVGQSFRRIQRSQQEAELRLAELVQATATADERARLAREVHDSLAKSLQGLAFGAASLPSWVDRDGERARVEAAALARGATQAVQDARTLLTRMRSDEPHRPFDQVLGDLVTAWGEQHGHPVVTQLAPTTGLAADARYELLAAVREVLENVRRHAPGAAVAVRMNSSGGRCLVDLADDGPGFDTGLRSAREAAGHFGLRGLEERMGTVNGAAALESTPGAGTRVVFDVPLTDRNLLPR